MTELNASIRNIPLPDRMSRLQISDKGFPVPWFVAWIDGKPDFRVIDTPKLGIAFRHKRCWLCGGTMTKYQCFVVGPMCIVNRTSAEPPSHRECAEYAVVACPFLSRPKMRRNDNDLPEHVPPAGDMIMRNPGVTAIWSTEGYKIKHKGPDGVLFDIGNPRAVWFYAHGRIATRAEIMESIESGLPFLQDVAKLQPGGLDELEKMLQKALPLVPA